MEAEVVKELNKKRTVCKEGLLVLRANTLYEEPFFFSNRRRKLLQNYSVLYKSTSQRGGNKKWKTFKYKSEILR